MSTYLQFDPLDIFAKLEAAAEAMCETEEVASRLEELKSVLLAELAVEFKDQGKPIGECEMRAKSNVRYRVHIEGMCIARRKANRAKARYKDLQILSELRRTQESSARTMITRGA